MRDDIPLLSKEGAGVVSTVAKPPYRCCVASSFQNGCCASFITTPSAFIDASPYRARASRRTPLLGKEGNFIC